MKKKNVKMFSWLNLYELLILRNSYKKVNVPTQSLGISFNDAVFPSALIVLNKPQLIVEVNMRQEMGTAGTGAHYFKYKQYIYGRPYAHNGFNKIKYSAMCLISGKEHT